MSVKFFGQFLIEEGEIDAAELREALAFADASPEHIYLGEALVHLGHLEAARLEALLADFKRDQAPYELDEVRLPSALSGSAAAAHVVDLLPKLGLEVARVRMKLGAPEPFSGSLPEAHRARVVLGGSRGLAVTLACDAELAVALAGTHGPAGEASLSEAVAEFLNVVAGTAASVAERDGERVELTPPEAPEAVSGAFRYPLAGAAGHGALLLEPA